MQHSHKIHGILMLDLGMPLECTWQCQNMVFMTKTICSDVIIYAI
jgi:hypothetical protein